MHFISPKGGTEGCQLSLLRYQRRPKRHARGPSACMPSVSSGTLFSGAVERAQGDCMPTGCGRNGGQGGSRVYIPGHCLQQSEGLTRTGLAQVRRGHCTFSQCTSPVVPCGERAQDSGGHWSSPALRPPRLTLQVQMAHLMRPNGGTTGCQRVPEPRHVLSPSK